MRKTANPKVPRLVEKPMPGTMAAYADEYYQWLAERNYSPNTIKNRQVYVYFFMKWADERGLVEPEEVTRPVIEQYQRYLYHYKKKRSEGTLAVNSQYARLIAVCGYFKWLARQNYILYNPTADIIMPRVGKRLPANVLSAEDADQIINQADVNDIMGIRDRAMLETLYSTGVRRSELIEITVYDIDFDRGTVFVHGKGNKDRVIPIGEMAAGPFPEDKIIMVAQLGVDVGELVNAHHRGPGLAETVNVPELQRACIVAERAKQLRPDGQQPPDHHDQAHGAHHQPADLVPQPSQREQHATGKPGKQPVHPTGVDQQVERGAGRQAQCNEPTAMGQVDPT